MSWLTHLKGAIANLNPNEVRQEAERPLSIGLRATTELSYFQMETFFAPSTLSEDRRDELHRVLVRLDGEAGAGQLQQQRHFDVEIHTEGAGEPHGSFLFCFSEPERTVREILASRHDLSLALARSIPPFRQPVTDQIIHSVSKENAVFSLATALPDLVPFLSLPWAAGEFASDTAVLTANQVRMAFLLGAASDRAVGYREQKAEIASIIGGAFGWRSLARELAGKIPLGGGLIPKAGIAYAGTWVVGRSLERYYRLGYGLTRDERRAAFDKALARGKAVAGAILKNRKFMSKSA
jgi:uncharacterized protein (DUF697 family)